jgi:uncharacterized protein YjbI with pentapeptide repeats
MKNAEQVALLKAGVEGWNKWREKEPDERISLELADLEGANLAQANLRGANLWYANLTEAKLREADLTGADLWKANLTRADLTEANLHKASLTEARLWATRLWKANLIEARLRRANLKEAIFWEARLTGADLWKANLTGADLLGADLHGADLTGADLTEARLIEADLTEAVLKEATLLRANLTEANLYKARLTGADLTGANLLGAALREADLSGASLINSNLVEADSTNAKISKCRVYGVNVWNLKGEFKAQKDLVISPLEEPSVTVDNIKVAQFIYLILNNKEIRDVINTLTSRAVLILGRFRPRKRKAVLDALRNTLRKHSLLPIVFDFDRPTDKDFTETIKTLAGLCYFVIADITNPKSSPLELQATVPDYQIPFVPIIQEGEEPFAMMVDLQKKYKWVLETRSYDTVDTLLKTLKPGIIDPAIKMHYELRAIKAKKQKTLSLKELLSR